MNKRSLSPIFDAAILLVLLLCFSSVAQAAAPAFQAAGTVSAGTGARTVAWPTHAVDDIALLVVQTANQAVTLSTPAGFVQVLNSPQGTGTAGGTAATRLTVFWARATSSSMASPVVADSGNNQVAQIVTFRNVIGTGNPWDVTAGDVLASASTGFTIPSATTTVQDTLLLAIVANGTDSTTSQTSGWTNVNLSGLTEITDVNRTSGNGGGFGITAGVMATAGNYGSTTGVLATSSVQGRMSIALKPLVAMNCFTDNFTGTDGSSPSSDWTTTSSSGTFGQPKIYSNRLRLTNATNNVATAAHLQKLFPGAGNKIIVEFDYFAYNGSGADGIALTLSDASISPQAGAYGGSLGYAQRCGINGFTGGWLGIGFDEYGNFRNDGECRGDGGSPTGLVPDSVSVRGSGSGTTGYLIHAESGALSPGVDQPGSTAGPGHRYRITIDHSNGTNAWVRGERNTGSGYATIIPQYDAKAQSGQATVPTNWLLSYTGSTGGATNIHEIDNLSVCTTQPILPVGVHHIEIDHPTGTGVTCTQTSGTTSTSLTLKACPDATCTPPLYQGGVQGNMTATGSPTVNWVGGTSFTIGATGTTTKDVQVTTTGSVVFGTNSGSNPTTCNFGAPSCTFTSSLAGFLFDVPNHGSDTLQTITVSAVKQADNSLVCTPAFASTSKTINFACAYSDPTSGTLPVAVAGSDITCGGSGSGISLSFNGSGVATTTVRYADAGQIGLSSSYTGSGGSEAGLVMTGGDNFIAAPASFGVTPTGPYVAANPFSVTVTAKNASGNTTPNFGKESTTENVTLAHTLVGPTGGNNPALAGSTTLADASFQSGNGVATASNIKWGEVGDISITTTLASGSYLGSGLTVTGSGAAGPFRPAYFETEVTPGTGSFTYSGQPFTVKVTAKNADGGTTKNYAGAYAKAVTLSDANSATNKSTTLGSFTNATIAAASFIDYVSNPGNAGTATLNNISYAFTTKPTAPLEAPTSAPLALRAIDTVAVSSSGHLEGTTPIRAGRLRLPNAYGPETEIVTMPARLEYYDGTAFTLNNLDSQTNPGGTASYQLDNTLETAQTDGTIKINGNASTALTVGAINAGIINLTFSPPGAGKTGYADVTALITTSLPWLLYEWDGLDNDYNDPPSARVNFGIYRGNDRIINWREIVR